MKKDHFCKVLLLILASQFTTLFAAAQPNKIVITASFSTGNNMTGANPGTSHDKKVFTCISASGQITGSIALNAQGVLSILKNPDNIDQILRGLAGGRILKTLTIDYNSVSSNGQSTLIQRIILRSAQVSQFLSTSQQVQVNFFYKQLAITYMVAASGLTANDDWETPGS